MVGRKTVSRQVIDNAVGIATFCNIDRSKVVGTTGLFEIKLIGRVHCKIPEASLTHPPIAANCAKFTGHHRPMAPSPRCAWAMVRELQLSSSNFSPSYGSTMRLVTAFALTAIVNPLARFLSIRNVCVSQSSTLLFHAGRNKPKVSVPAAHSKCLVPLNLLRSST